MPLALRGRKEPRGLTDKSSNNLGLRLRLQNSCRESTSASILMPSFLSSRAYW